MSVLFDFNSLKRIFFSLRYNINIYIVLTQMKICKPLICGTFLESFMLTVLSRVLSNGTPEASRSAQL